MKRNLVIAAITAAALIGGGTAVAVSGTGGQEGSGADASAALPQLPSQTGSSDDSMTVSPTAPGPTDDSDDADDADDSDVSGVPGGSGSGSQDDGGPVQSRKGLSASEAAAAALAKYPGAVASVERDDDRADRWEVDLLGKDNRRRDLRVDPATGTVSVDRDDDGDDAGDGDERAALRAATVDVRKAASVALASVPGAVTSIEIDDDLTNRWEVEVRGKDGRSHELNVNAKTGKVTADRDDDGDDRGDDSGDDGYDD